METNTPDQNQPQNPPQTQHPQHQGLSEDTKTLITIALLIFFTPIGIIMMWVWMKWAKWLKILITVIPVLFIMFILFVIFGTFWLALQSPATVNKYTDKVVEKTSPDLAKKTRDSQRMSDLATINQAITIDDQESTAKNVLCQGIKAPCDDSSDKNTVTNLNGTGWIRVDLTKYAKVLTQLPLDPVNNNQFFYRYCSDGKDWELNTSLESDNYKNKAVSDGGDNNQLYEVGSDLSICK